MQKIKPAEISALLKQQLDSANIHSEFDEIGTVLEVGDGIARVYGLSNAEYGDSRFSRLVWKKKRKLILCY